RGLIEILQRRYDRKASDEFWDQAILQQVLGLDIAEDLALLAVLRRHDLGAEADRGRTPARRNNLLETGESAAADEQNIRGVDLQEFLLRMLAAPCGGTLAIVPSMILSSACCTPSPETSRVI